MEKEEEIIILIWEKYILYIEKENQGKGIGKKLINECFESLKKMGYKDIIIRCLKGNPSEGFYKNLGGKVIDAEDGTIGETKITENVYQYKLV